MIVWSPKVSSCNITGVWRNELGSTLRVKAEGSEVKGVYQTAVESTRGAAGSHRTARIIGVVGNGIQPAVSFSVLWEEGKVRLNGVMLHNTRPS